MAKKVALLLDGGFVRKRLSDELGRFPTIQDVDGLRRSVIRELRAHADIVL